ncbi:UvrABC system protein [Trichinella spiralis]|uniref:UvrABC system protein n=1 Tax=Trichinella spiralis TaxID=6334 RepID=A0ABR3K308_TRISP
MWRKSVVEVEMRNRRTGIAVKTRTSRLSEVPSDPRSKRIRRREVNPMNFWFHAYITTHLSCPECILNTLQRYV